MANAAESTGKKVPRAIETKIGRLLGPELERLLEVAALPISNPEAFTAKVLYLSAFPDYDVSEFSAGIVSSAPGLARRPYSAACRRVRSIVTEIKAADRARYAEGHQILRAMRRK